MAGLQDSISSDFPLARPQQAQIPEDHNEQKLLLAKASQLQVTASSIKSKVLKNTHFKGQKMKRVHSRELLVMQIFLSTHHAWLQNRPVCYLQS